MTCDNYIDHIDFVVDIVLADSDFFDFDFEDFVEVEVEVDEIEFVVDSLGFVVDILYSFASLDFYNSYLCLGEVEEEDIY